MFIYSLSKPSYLMKKYLILMKQAKTGNAFQQDQKLYQNEKVSMKKKNIWKKNQCTAAGELSSPLVKEWKIYSE